MKFFIFLLSWITIISNCYSQANRYYQPSVSTYTPQFVPETSNFDILFKAAETWQARYDQNSKYLYSLSGWISEIKTQTNDKQLHSKLNRYQDQLNTLEKLDLSLATNDLRQIELYIKDAVHEYNIKIESTNKLASLYEEALSHYESGDYSSAASSAARIINSNPNESYGYLLRAHSYYAMGQFSIANKDFRTVLRLDPQNIDAKLIYGWSLAYDEKYLESEELSSSIIIKQPQNGNAYFLRGYVLSAKGEYESANLDYNKATELNPNLSMAYNNWGYNIFKSGGDLEEALRLVNKSLEVDTKNLYAWNSRGEIYFHLKRYKESKFSMDQAIKLNPGDGLAYLIRGRANYRMGLKKEACEDWRKAGEAGEFSAFEYLQNYCGN